MPAARNTALKPAVPEEDFTLEDAVFEEDANFNLDSAIRAYRKVIARFDNQRRDAALAVFRLGECYRKLGRVPQARAQYQRILKEFSDQHQLTRLSQARLSAEGKAADNAAYSDAVLERLTKRRQSSLGLPAGANNVPHLDANEVQASVEAPAHSALTPPRALDEFDAPKSKPAEENGIESDDSGPAPAQPGSRPPRAPTPERNLVVPGASANVEAPPTQYQQSYTASRARAAAVRARSRADVLDRTIRLIENSPVESLPEPVSIDPRYRKLKDAYEAFLLEDTDEGNKKAAETLKKMEIWINKIYLPELRSAQRAAMDQAIGANSSLSMPAPVMTLRP